MSMISPLCSQVELKMKFYGRSLCSYLPDTSEREREKDGTFLYSPFLGGKGKKKPTGPR